VDGRDRDFAEALARRVREVLARAQAAVEQAQLLTSASQVAKDRDAMVRHCAWCGRLSFGERWLEAERAPRFLVGRLVERATHGICPDCFGRLERTGLSRSRSFVRQ